MESMILLSDSWKEAAVRVSLQHPDDGHESLCSEICVSKRDFFETRSI